MSRLWCWLHKATERGTHAPCTHPHKCLYNWEIPTRSEHRSGADELVRSGATVSYMSLHHRGRLAEGEGVQDVPAPSLAVPVTLPPPATFRSLLLFTRLPRRVNDILPPFPLLPLFEVDSIHPSLHFSHPSPPTASTSSAAGRHLCLHRAHPRCITQHSQLPLSFWNPFGLLRCPTTLALLPLPGRAPSASYAASFLDSPCQRAQDPGLGPLPLPSAPLPGFSAPCL